MSEIQPTKETELQRILDEVTRLRDEIQVRLHLATLDAKDEWSRIQPKLAEIERKAEGRTVDAVHALAGQLRAFAARLPRHEGHS